MKRCIRCDDLVNTLMPKGLCELCVTETSPKDQIEASDEFICLLCKEPGKKHRAKGYCEKCYMKQRKPPKTEDNAETSLSVTIPFLSQDIELYKELTESARINRRTLQNEILYTLDWRQK